MLDAARYQDHTACIPYIIEGTGSFPMSGVPFPDKTCAQYVEIRSSQGAHFTPGQRYNPSTDDAYAFGLQGAKVLGNGSTFGTPGGTRYWRFRNVNFFTDATGGATYPVTGASWSGGVATLTVTGTTPNAQFSVSGISPPGYNFGNTANTGHGGPLTVGAGTLSYQVASDPGAYSGGGTVTLLYQYGLSSFIAWGGGFDSNVMPDHLEVIQCAFHGDGNGDVSHGIMISGSNVRIIDSYFSGIQNPGTDAGPLVVEHGDNLEVRNNYLGGGDETFGVGGSVVSAGTIPRFEYFLGNQIAKEPWIGMMSGATGPGSLPCWQGKWFHNTTTNTDYLCSSVSGTWTAQANLLTRSQRASKNLWECKICQAVRMVGNDFGFISGQTGQGANGLVFNLVSQPYSGPCSGGLPSPCTSAQPWTTIADVTIQANKFHDGFSPFSLSYADPSYHPCKSIDPGTGLPYAPPCYQYGHHNVRFVHNLITNVADERSYCPSYGGGPGGYCVIAANSSPFIGGSVGPAVLNNADYDIDISNNTQTTSTFSPASGLAYGFGANAGSSHDFSGMVHVRNNIGPIGHYGWTPANGCGMEAMFLLYGGGLDLHNNILTSDPSFGDTWQAFTTGSVTPACATDTSSTIWPSDHVGGASWATYLDTVTFRAKSGHQNGGTDERDQGADIDLVKWRTANAVDGAPNPALDFAIRSLTATSTGATIQFSAPDTSACTWELSTDPNAYASPVAVSSQTRIGRHGVAVWNEGALAGSTTYWARVTCAGNKLEYLANGDRAMLITAPSTAPSTAPVLLSVASYSMLNGMRHNVNYYDIGYTGGTGDPHTPLSPLSGGKGYLTDRTLPTPGNPKADPTRPPVLITASTWTTGTVGICSGGCLTITVGSTAASVGLLEVFNIYQELTDYSVWFVGFNQLADSTTVTFPANAPHPELVGMYHATARLHELPRASTVSR